MTAIMLTLVSSILGIFQGKSKFFAIGIFLFMWSLFGWNYMNGDYELYEQMYYSATDSVDLLNYEGGYRALMFLSNQIGLNFQSFFIIVSGITLALLLRITFAFSKRPAMIAAVLLIFILPIQYVLLRNFLSFAIMAQGIIPVLNQSKNSKLKFIGYTLIACTIHISSIFYLFFLFAFTKKKIKIQSVSALILLILFIFIAFEGFILPKIVSGSGGRESFYATHIAQFLLYSFYQILNYFIIKLFYDKYKESNTDPVEISKFETLFKINIILLFLIIIYYKFAIFIRIFLNISFINIIFMLNVLCANRKFTAGKIILFFYLLFIFFLFIFPVMEDSLYSLYNFNLLYR